MLEHILKLFLSYVMRLSQM